MSARAPSTLALLGLALLPACSSPLAAGPEIQLYPAGMIVGAHLQTPLNARDSITYRLAANITERGDFGEHDDESGEGFGGGIGWRRIYPDGGPGDGWIIGARVDIWDLTIDWEDDNPVRRGSTDTLVIQPTIEGGYRYDLGSGWRMQLMAGVGAEINTSTDGEDVGEGAIMLAGLTFLYDF